MKRYAHVQRVRLRRITFSFTLTLSPVRPNLLSSSVRLALTGRCQALDALAYQLCRLNKREEATTLYRIAIAVGEHAARVLPSDSETER